MTDIYTCFGELKKKETEGIDYRIVQKHGASNWGIIAIHGGGIEPGTTDIASAIAGEINNLYCFEGIKPKGNGRLHIRSTRFDEPQGIQLIRSMMGIVSIHGCRGNLPEVLVGGGHLELKRHITYQLISAGFNAKQHASNGLEGKAPGNVCNRCLDPEGGVQFEISWGLRLQMMPFLKAYGKHRYSPLFFHFVQTVQRILT